ncbi:MAG TPA: hypothetical protein VEM41_02045 [Actinomycetota bacterium]|nr:hypothetical protein [Actinomycetota bacterium]
MRLHKVTVVIFVAAAVAGMLGSPAGASVTPASCGSWAEQVSPNPTTNSWLNAAWAASATDVWAVGEGTTDGSPLIEHLTLAGWVLVPASPDASGIALSGVSGSSARSVWAVGQEGFIGSQAASYHWDGTSWTRKHVPKLKDSALYGVSSSKSAGTWAVGGYSAGGKAAALILHRVGSTWQQVPSASPGKGRLPTLSAVDMVSPTLGWAVGSSTDKDGNSYPLIEQWDGSSWSIVPPDPAVLYGTLEAVQADATSAMVAGSFGTQSGALVELWDGSAWTSVSTPAPQYTQLDAIAGNLSGTDWVVGGEPGGSTNVILQERAGSWKRQSSPDPGPDNDFLSGVAAAGSHAWAVGSYRDGIVTSTLIVHNC